MARAHEFFARLDSDPVRPAHPDFGAGGIIRADVFRGFPPRSGAGKKSVGGDFDFSRRMFPWRMPDAKEAGARSPLSEGRVAFEQELRERVRVGGREIGSGNFSFISEPPFRRVNEPAQPTATWRVLINEAPESIRQTERPRPETHAQWIREPFGQEIDARFAPMPDIGADVEEFVGRDRFEKPLANPSPDPPPQPGPRSSDNTDVGAPIVKIERERNVALQRRRVCRVVNEDGAIPARVQHRFAPDREHPTARRFTQGAANRGDAFHVQSGCWPND